MRSGVGGPENLIPRAEGSVRPTLPAARRVGVDSQVRKFRSSEMKVSVSNFYFIRTPGKGIRVGFVAADDFTYLEYNAKIS